jgi:hypothetical protein
MCAASGISVSVLTGSAACSFPGVVPGRPAVRDYQHRQSRVPEPADKQFDAVRGDELCTAPIRGFRHGSIMRQAGSATEFDEHGRVLGVVFGTQPRATWRSNVSLVASGSRWIA